MTRILTYGTFDLLHPGHIQLLKYAASLGDWLAVGLSTDEFNRIKGKNSLYSFEDRKILIEGLKYIDLVFPESSWEQKREDIKKFNADIFIMGDDWRGKFDDLSDLCQVVYFPRIPDLSSTIIKNIIKNN